MRCRTKRLPFDGIRTITGYLVGAMDKWNDSKCAEERDRVKPLTNDTADAKQIPILFLILLPREKNKNIDINCLFAYNNAC